MKISLFNRCSKGRLAEDMACRHLQRQGLSLLQKNFHSRFGEIDLIMQHEQTLVFVEVRYRKNRDFGGPAASITQAKQEKIQKTALYYMQHKGREFNARFDVLAICGDDLRKPQQLHIEWIKNAF
jgi:putative endonuclease